MSTVTELPSLDGDDVPADQMPFDGMPEAPAAVDAPEDPAAPYGRTVDGRPKRRPGRPRKARANAAGPKPAAAPAARKPAGRKPAGPDYGAAVAGPLSLIGMAMAAAGQRTGNLPLLADALAIQTHTPAIAKATADLAEQDARVAALLEKLAHVGPYGALIGALAPLIIQIGVNHNAVPAGVVPALAPLGIQDAVTLLRSHGFTVTEPAEDQAA